jgi:nanoRNase/pAp phosphatase (c-di-AMP/oligoRNAs hydrolase)
LKLGGGGHPAAAGCTILGTLAEVEAQVVMQMKAIRAEQYAQRNHAR